MQTEVTDRDWVDIGEEVPTMPIPKVTFDFEQLMHQHDRDHHESVHFLLDELDEMPPGPGLIAGMIDLRESLLDSGARVRLAGGWARVASWVEAETLRQLAPLVAEGKTPEEWRDSGQEWAWLTRTTTMGAMNRLTRVRVVADGHPLGFKAMEAAQLSPAHIRALTDVTQTVSPALARRVEARVVPPAIEKQWTPPQLRAAAQRALLAIAPDVADEARKSAKESETDVTLNHHGRGLDLGRIEGVGEAAHCQLIMDGINKRVELMQADGDARPVGVLRMVALSEAVIGRAQTANPKVEVLLSLDLETWLGLARNPGELSGFGPVSDSYARELSDNANLRRLLTDPLSGEALDLGRRSYRVSRPLRRLMVARDWFCRFPGCNRRAIELDRDHITSWLEHGLTNAPNLQSLCRWHHTFKTTGRWRVQKSKTSNEIRWTSPNGFVRHARPPSRPFDGIKPASGEDLLDGRGRASARTSANVLQSESVLPLGKPPRSSRSLT